MKNSSFSCFRSVNNQLHNKLSQENQYESYLKRIQNIVDRKPLRDTSPEFYMTFLHKCKQVSKEHKETEEEIQLVRKNKHLLNKIIETKTKKMVPSFQSYHLNMHEKREREIEKINDENMKIAKRITEQYSHLRSSLYPKQQKLEKIASPEKKTKYANWNYSPLKERKLPKLVHSSTNQGLEENQSKVVEKININKKQKSNFISILTSKNSSQYLHKSQFEQKQPEQKGKKPEIKQSAFKHQQNRSQNQKPNEKNSQSGKIQQECPKQDTKNFIEPIPQQKPSSQSNAKNSQSQKSASKISQKPMSSNRQKQQVSNKQTPIQRIQAKKQMQQVKIFKNTEEKPEHEDKTQKQKQQKYEQEQFEDDNIEKQEQPVAQKQQKQNIEESNKKPQYNHEKENQQII